jgi:hypothetical protein
MVVAFLLVAGYVWRNLPAVSSEKPPVAMVKTSLGHRAPAVDALPPRPGSIPSLAETLEKDRSGRLSRYLRAYFHYASDLAVKHSPTDPEATVIEFSVDTFPGHFWRLDWEASYPMGIRYRGNPAFNARRLDEIAYGILLEWTGSDSHREAVRVLYGESEYPELDFHRALVHIHRQLLPYLYVPGFQQRSSFRPMPRADQVRAVVERGGEGAALALLTERLKGNVRGTLEYLENMRREDPSGYKQHAYVALTYFLGPSVFFQHELRDQLNLGIAGSESKEALERQREERLKAEREARERAEQARLREERIRRIQGSGIGSDPRS